MTKKRDIRWWSSPRQVLRTILMLDDTPHHIALGTAIGMFIAITPTVGIQMILVVILATLTRPLFYFNRAAALVTVYVSNPVTMVPLYWFNYKVGTLFYSSSLSWGYFQQLRTLGWWDALIRVFVEIGAPLIVGSLLTATVAGVLTYPFIRWLLRVVSEPDESGPGRDRQEPVGAATD